MVHSRRVGLGGALGLAAAVAAVLPAATTALRGDDTLDVGGQVFGRWDQFGFLAGGQATLSAVMTSPSPSSLAPGDYVWLLACSDDQLDNLLDLNDAQLCGTSTTSANPLWTVCDGAAALGANNATAANPAGRGTNSSWSWSESIPSTTYYSFLAVSCMDADASFDVQWHWVNPGGEELSSGQIPLKATTNAFAAMWGIVGGLLLLAAVAAKARYDGATAVPEDRVALGPAASTPLRSLHVTLGAIPLAYLIAACLSHAFWVDLSQTGVVDTSRQAASIAFAALAAAILLYNILLVSRGWQITRLAMYSAEKRHVAFCLLVYVGVWVGWKLLPGFGFLFALVCVYILILRYVFSSVTWRLRLLRSFRDYVSSFLPGGTGATSPAAFVTGGGGGAAPPGAPATASRIVVDGHVFVFNEAGDLQPLGSVEEVAAADAAAAAAAATAAAEAAAAAGSAAAAAMTPVPAAAATVSEHAPLMPGGSGVGSPGARAGEGWWARLRRRTTDVIGDPAAIPEGALTNRQIKLLSTFRGAVLVFLTVDVLAQLWTMLALAQAPAVAYGISSAITWSMGVYMMWMLRPRASAAASPLYDPRGYGAAPLEESLLGEGGSAGGQGSSSSGGGGAPFTAGSASGGGAPGGGAKWGATASSSGSEPVVSHGAGGAHLLVPEDDVPHAAPGFTVVVPPVEWSQAQGSSSGGGSSA